MMASLQFQIHADKENALHAGLKNPSRSILGGKTFQSSSVQPLKTPRRALGSVNETHRVGGLVSKQSEGKARGLSLSPDRKLQIKDSEIKQSNLFNKENDVQKKKQQQGEKNPVLQTKQSAPQNECWAACLPDIEYMPPPSPTKDEDEEDEEILPMNERASTYVHKILKWRPGCLFGTLPESDDEDDERELQRVMDELDNLPALSFDLLQGSYRH
jgi:hypothetical protein